MVPPSWRCTYLAALRCNWLSIQHDDCKCCMYVSTLCARDDGMTSSHVHAIEGEKCGFATKVTYSFLTRSVKDIICWFNFTKSENSVFVLNNNVANVSATVQCPALQSHRPCKPSIHACDSCLQIRPGSTTIGSSGPVQMGAIYLVPSGIAHPRS